MPKCQVHEKIGGTRELERREVSYSFVVRENGVVRNQGG